MCWNSVLVCWREREREENGESFWERERRGKQSKSVAMIGCDPIRELKRSGEWLKDKERGRKTQIKLFNIF
jgi:hypothetical protein